MICLGHSSDVANIVVVIRVGQGYFLCKFRTRHESCECLSATQLLSVDIDMPLSNMTEIMESDGSIIMRSIGTEQTFNMHEIDTNASRWLFAVLTGVGCDDMGNPNQPTTEKSDYATTQTA